MLYDLPYQDSVLAKSNNTIFLPASVESVLHPAVSTDMGDPCTWMSDHPLKSNGAHRAIKKSETDNIADPRVEVKSSWS